MTPDLLRPFEEMLNRQIAARAARAALLAAARRPFDGAALRGDAAAGPGLARASDGTLTMRPAATKPADAVIEGTPLSFLRLATGDAAQSIRAGGTDVRGDAEIAEGFRKLLDAARPDLEEELSRVTGDVAAHYLAGFARDAVAFGRRARDTFARNAAEYLTEESRDLPVRLEVDEFLTDVDRLREADRSARCAASRPPSARGAPG